MLPGYPLTYDLYTHGPDRRHWIWLAVVMVVVAWRGWLGCMPGCEERPYIHYYGVHQPNLPYRVVCYTAAWIDILVPFALNVAGLVMASITGVLTCTFPLVPSTSTGLGHVVIPKVV